MLLSREAYAVGKNDPNLLFVEKGPPEPSLLRRKSEMAGRRNARCTSRRQHGIPLVSFKFVRVIVMVNWS